MSTLSLLFTLLVILFLCSFYFQLFSALLAVLPSISFSLFFCFLALYPCFWATLSMTLYPSRNSIFCFCCSFYSFQVYSTLLVVLSSISGVLLPLPVVFLPFHYHFQLYSTLLVVLSVSGVLSITSSCFLLFPLFFPSFPLYFLLFLLFLPCISCLSSMFSALSILSSHYTSSF